MELKEGMYVRTKSGIIAKIICTRINPLGKETIYVLDKEINIDELEMGDLYIATNPLSNDMANIIDTHFGDDKILAKEPSYNIIDLIEVGDYVNGRLVTSVEDVYTTDNIYIGREVIVEHDDLIIEKDIKSIVTKEMFSNVEYRVETD